MDAIGSVLDSPWLDVGIPVVGCGALVVVTWLRPARDSDKLLLAIPSAESSPGTRLRELRRQARLMFRRDIRTIVILWALILGFSGVIAAIEAVAYHILLWWLAFIVTFIVALGAFLFSAIAHILLAGIFILAEYQSVRKRILRDANPYAGNASLGGE